MPYDHITGNSEEAFPAGAYRRRHIQMGELHGGGLLVEGPWLIKHVAGELSVDCCPSVVPWRYGSPRGVLGHSDQAPPVLKFSIQPTTVNRRSLAEGEQTLAAFLDLGEKQRKK